MAIVNMVSKDSGTDGAYCPFPFPREWLAQGATEPSFALVRSFEGCVISEREMNGYDDSDFYALVWDAEQKSFREILFASTRGWTYPCFATAVDATPEVRALWNAYCERDRAKAEYEAEQRAIRAVQREAETPRVGKRVRVVKGRKVAKGTEWWVTSDEIDSYKPGSRRLGLRNDDGERTWTSADNCEVMILVSA